MSSASPRRARTLGRQSSQEVTTTARLRGMGVCQKSRAPEFGRRRSEESRRWELKCGASSPPGSGVGDRDLEAAEAALRSWMSELELLVRTSRLAEPFLRGK